MTKTFKSTDKTQLTTHFNVSEFKCKCGGSHDIKLDTDLADKLEKLHKTLNCSKIIINSGYRCSTHDRNVGGSGSGQHVNGCAADIVCYDQQGNRISSKKVCCAAQDIGFGGIANIDATYTATHVDTRTANFWKGDEVITYACSVTDDFYKYYGILKCSDKKVLAKGIDVSEHQGLIDWEKVKFSGEVDFVILRAGYGKEINQIDKQFERNYSECKRLGIPCGSYWYSYATTVDEAKQEAEVFLKAIKGKQFNYPVYFDLEEPKQLALGKEKCSEIAETFLKAVEKSGYFVGLYMSKSHLETHISEGIRKRYAVWVAHYGVSKTSYSGQFGMWQKSTTGCISGVSGNIDLDECYQDYPVLIQNAGLNGLKKSTAVEKKKKDFIITVDGVTYSGTLTEK